MKKFLLNILLFFGIVAVVDYSFGRLCVFLTDHGRGGVAKEVKNVATTQVAKLLIMGSSRAHHHYIPSILSDSLDITTHNAGIDGNGIVTAKGLYSLISERYHPRAVIYDVTPKFDVCEFSGDGKNTRYLGTLRPYFGNPGVNDVLNVVNPREKYKNQSAMFRYNSKIINLIINYFYAGNYRADGYSPLYKKMEIVKKKNGSIGELASQKNEVCFDSLKLHLFESFVSEVKQSGTRLIVVASPLYGAKSSNEFVPVKEICSRYGVEYWDYLTDQRFQKPDYFADGSHLNDKGATAFSSVVASRLKTE